MQRRDAAEDRRRSPRSSCSTAHRCARCRTSPACPRRCARCPTTAPRCWSRRAPRPRRRSPSRSTAIVAELAAFALATPLRFATDPAEAAALWNVRKGMFPAVGAMRPTGTTVIIEDVAFPIERLAEATIDLQKLLQGHGYREAIIFGHALEGNLHFVFTQDFGSAAEVERYRGFMAAMCAMVVAKYDGSLKAEHGTGRNVAPFVELEWGAQALATMRRIKELLDPQGLLNPGVILNDDPLVAPEEPEAAACRRPDRRQVHRVRLLRAQVPVARPDLVAAPAHRRLARDRPPRCRRERARALGGAEAALRLQRHRDLRRLRPVRDRVPGRDRDRACSSRRCADAARARWPSRSPVSPRAATPA